jgi:uncharacterized protein YegP (UPF0339 family)
MAKFAITTRINGEFQFNLQTDNGLITLTSEGYGTKPNCENGIESVRKNSQDDSKFDLKTSSDGKPYFNLKATNGQVIGTSQMYESEETRQIGIASVKATAPDATVDDQAA